MRRLLRILWGLPLRRAVAAARDMDVPIRVYVPYGHASLPYELDRLAEDPRIAWWALRDLWWRRGEPSRHAIELAL